VYVKGCDPIGERYKVKIIRAKNYEDMSRKAANLISAQVILKPDSVLGLATGSTPIGIYQQLAEWYKKGDIDFSEVTTVNLDEYYGLTPQHHQSYHYFMQHEFFDHVNLSPEHTFLPDGMEQDHEKECTRYTALIYALGGIDLQLLGLGHNGHIGFNEPSDYFSTDVHLVNLTESTIHANQRFFASADDVPRQAYTMGIRTIFLANRILLAVSGKDKADIVRTAFLGKVTPTIPASILQLHPDVWIIGDEDALSEIPKGAVV